MTQVRFSIPRSTLLLSAAFVGLCAVTGCNSPAPERPSLAAATAPRPVAMKGDGQFFDGQIAATLSISRGFERVGEGRGEYGRRRFYKDEEIDLPDPSDNEYAENISKIMMLQIRGSPMPPVTLRMSLSNRSPQPLDVEIVEFNSDLGNFAVQPDRLSLPAGQAGEPDPMHSQLGLASEEIPVKVVLRMAGKTDSKVIVVKSLFTPDGKRK